MLQTQQEMKVVIVGHVDHGKSTIIGRLMADTDSLPKGKLEQIQETCRRNAKPFEYAFLLDALKEEQAQGITIDVARCFFRSAKRNYIIMDAPGHVEFLKNMVTGASQAEAALLVIDALEGIQANSIRHGYLLSLLGIERVVILINKMDLVDYSEEVYLQVVNEYSKLLAKIAVKPLGFIPVSGRMGDNIAKQSKSIPWYNGPTVLQLLDSLEPNKPSRDLPFRMPVQGVYKFTESNDTRRIIAGTVDSGVINVGDEVVFYPSGKRSRIQSIESFPPANLTSAAAGMATGFTLTEQIFVRRGEIAVRAGDTGPMVSSRLQTKLFWLGKEPLVKDKTYTLKLGTSKTRVRLESVNYLLDAGSLMVLENSEQVARHTAAECVFKLDKAIAFDSHQFIASTGRFVIVDEYEVAGGGIVQKALEDNQGWLRQSVMRKNSKWMPGLISLEERAERLNQSPCMVVITGSAGQERKELAQVLEQRLFREGKIVYYLSLGNLMYSVDADIKNVSNNHKEEHLRRLAEVCGLMLDAGLILLVTARELTKEDLSVLITTIDPEQVKIVWLGELTNDLCSDLHLNNISDIDGNMSKVKKLLQDNEIIYKAGVTAR